MMGVAIIVLFAFNYQSGKDVVPLSEIFPEEDFETLPDIEYEFVTETPEPAAEVATGPSVEIQAPAASTAAAPAPVPSETLASTAPAPAPAAEPAPAPTVTDPAKNPFTIQVASYKDQATAEAGLKKVQSSGHPAYVARADLGPKGTYYRIYVGSFPTKSAADSYLTKVKRDFKDSFIISTK